MQNKKLFSEVLNSFFVVVLVCFLGANLQVVSNSENHDIQEEDDRNDDTAHQLACIGEVDLPCKRNNQNHDNAEGKGNDNVD